MNDGDRIGQLFYMTVDRKYRYKIRIAITLPVRIIINYNSIINGCKANV
jgi:hypothetical protein